MYLIRDRKSKQILFIDYAAQPAPTTGEAVYQGFDSTTMEIGWTDKTHIPAYCDIDATGRIVELNLDEAARRGWHRLGATQKLVNGKIVTKNEEELINEGLIDLELIKTQTIEACSKAALDLRTKLIPDYKLQNAAMGVYEEDRLPAYRATIQAFRNEFHRLKAAIEKAQSISELKLVAPQFPTSIVEIDGSGSLRKDTPRREK